VANNIKEEKECRVGVFDAVKAGCTVGLEPEELFDWSIKDNCHLSKCGWTFE
jgi:hypothetical protein